MSDELLTAGQIRDIKSLCEAGMHLGGAKLKSLCDEVLRLKAERAELKELIYSAYISRCVTDPELRRMIRKAAMNGD
jgi:hypothetical protein